MFNTNKYFTQFNSKDQEKITLGEGNTPLYEAKKLANFYGLKNLYIKDETKNPSGSFKDRAIANQLSYYIKENKNHFVISSTGNAAISAALYCSKFDLYLDIFITSNTPKYKIERLLETINNNPNITIHYTNQPKKEAFQFAKDNNFINLRQSTDKLAIEGYISLGKEILNSAINTDGIFMPVSSGTGLLGVATGTNNSIPLFAIQTEKVFNIAKEFDTKYTPHETSLSNAISAKYSPLKNDLIHAINSTKGFSFAISDTLINETLKELYEIEGIKTSYDSILSIAGLKRAMKEKMPINSPICILTGV